MSPRRTRGLLLAAAMVGLLGVSSVRAARDAAREEDWIQATFTGMGEGDKYHHHGLRVDAVLSGARALRPGSVIDVWVDNSSGPEGGPWLVRLRPYREPEDRGWFQPPVRGPATWPLAAKLVPLHGATRSWYGIDYANLTQLSDTTLIEGTKRSYTLAMIAPVAS